MFKRVLGVSGVALAFGLVLVWCSSGVDPDVERAENEALETIQESLEDGAGEYRAVDVEGGRAIVLYPEEDSEFGGIITALQEEVNVSSEREEGTETLEDIGVDLGMVIVWGVIASSLVDIEKELTSEYLENHSVGLASPTDDNTILLLVNGGRVVQDEVLNLHEESLE